MFKNPRAQSPRVAVAMSEVHVTGSVSFQGGAAVLTLTPHQPAQEPSSASNPNPTFAYSPRPWPLSDTRLDKDILAAIQEGKVEIHATRMPMDASTLRIMLNNMQRGLKLQVGLGGEWNPKADAKLLALLLEPKRDRNIKEPDSPTIKDKKRPLAIEAGTCTDGMTNDIPEDNGEFEPNVSHNDGPGDSSSDSSSSSSSSSSSMSMATVQRVDTSEWPNMWKDAFASGLDLLRSSSNDKQRVVCTRLLNKIHTAKSQYDEAHQA